MIRRAVGFGLALAALAAPAGASAQAVDTTLVTPDFNALKTPESPAFTILGIAPTAIARPTSPRGFAVSFLDALEEGDRGSLIPPSFAVEANPYWWSPRPRVSFEEYRNEGAASLYRNLTVSLASTDSVLPLGPDGNGSTSFRRLAVGLKTTVHGRQTPLRCVAELDRLLAAVSEPLAGRVAEAIQADPTLAADPERLEALNQSLLRESAEDLDRIDQLRGPCTQKAAQRTGFVMDVAAAAAFGFLESSTAGVPGVPGTPTFGDGLSTAGAWLTPSYLGESLGAIGVVRMLHEGLERTESVRMTDLGARAVYSRGRLAASVEALYRRVGESQDPRNQYRVAAVFDVRVSGDVWLTSSFGKGFESEGGGLIALANLQWAFGKPQPGRVPPR